MIQLNGKTLAELCVAAGRQYGKRPAFTMIREGKACAPVSYQAMAFRARQLAMLLAELGVAPGDRVLLLGDNAPEWPIAYFGIALAGAVCVPLLTGFSPEQVQHIADHAQVSAVIISREISGKMQLFREVLPIIVLEDIGTMTGSDTMINHSCRPDDLATIIYTSGTSGSSKGVMLSHANLMSCALTAAALVKISCVDRVLSVLPLAHAYECCLGLLVPIIGGAHIAYLDRPPSASVLLPAAQLMRPTIMATVPVFIEKIYRNKIAPKLSSNILYRCPATRTLAIRAAGFKIRKALGGKIRFFGIGGAPLTGEVEQFLRRARFPYAIGYGLTEAAPLIAGAAPGKFPLRSTGTAIQGVDVRIAPCDFTGRTGENTGNTGENTGIGEIQVRGPNVMIGYYRNEVQTGEVFTADGWLRTGDLGSMDREGTLYIRGRLKALILGPGGENIYPEEIEQLLGTSEMVEEALVYSCGKGELIAMVRLTDAAKAAATAAAFAVEHALEDLRSWANKKLASFSRLSKIEIRYEPFEKTPTMKIKRYLYA